MRIKLAVLLVLFLAIGGSAFAQGIRLDQTVTQQGTIAGVTNAVIIPPNSQIAFCNFPANAVPCSNKATTYTTNTLGTPCSTSTQIVLTGTTSCVASPDSQGNWGIWTAQGQYAYTITLPSGVSLGPFNVTLGIPSGTNITVGTLLCKNIENVRCVDTANSAGWAGTQLGDWINSALADCPVSSVNLAVSGCHIKIAAGAYTIANGHEINLTNATSRAVYLDCDPGSTYFTATQQTGTTIINYTGTGTLLTLNASFGKSGVDGCTLVGPGSGTAAIGIGLGGVNGAVLSETSRNDVSSFGIGIQINNNVYVAEINRNNVHDNGKNLFAPSGNATTGENLQIAHNAFSNKSVSFSTTCFDIEIHTDLTVDSNSFDQCGLTYNAVNLFVKHKSNHVENPSGTTIAPFLTIGTSCNFCLFDIDDKEWVEDGTAGARTEFIKDTSTVTNHAVFVHIFGGLFAPGETVAQLVNFAGTGGAACCAQGYVSHYMNGIGGPQFTNTFGGTGVFQTVSGITGQDCGATSTCSALSMSGNGTLKIVKGDVALVSGTPSIATITGFNPAFTSITSYDCTVSNGSTQANPVKITRVSASSITLTGPNTVTDIVAYICVGQ